jgi:chaperone BCS1
MAQKAVQIGKRQGGNAVNLHVQTAPFSPETLEGKLDLAEHVWLEVSVKSREYPLACAYISENGAPNSLRFREGGHKACRKGYRGMEPRVKAKAKAKAISVDCSDSDDDIGPLSPTTLGLGFFCFHWKGHDLAALHQRLGQPVTHHHGYTDIFTNLVLFAQGDDTEVLGQFVADLIIQSEDTSPGKVNLFEYNPEHQHWHHRGVCRARPMDSVVMDAQRKKQLVDDVNDFLDKDTRKWYRKHGIPHKRGYLFFGTPGAGKSSIIQALAGSIAYNICYVHPTHPKMSDAKLRHCVNEAPKRSLLIFEDVDAIFDKDRKPLVTNALLTFSGLLNALDGVGRANGQIFILTTNYRERLDSALIRNGRVDVHVEFIDADDAQIHTMFQRFYPEDKENLAKRFVEGLRTTLDGRGVSMAALQHFFILHRKASAVHAAESFRAVLDEMELRDEERHQAEKDTELKRQRGYQVGEDVESEEEE